MTKWPHPAYDAWLKMERTERLLDLVALFLDAKKPVSWAELRRAFPEDYGSGSEDAAERKFERDKAELLELGIPLSYLASPEEHLEGYVVEKTQYYLPDVGLTPEELAVLYAAGSAALASGAFPGSQDLAHALRKMGFLAGEPLPSPRVKMELGTLNQAELVSVSLEQLWMACSSRKWVDIQYYSPHSNQVTQRRVHPYGLALRRGFWSLVGFCDLRKDIRTFHVHRIRELQVNSAKPKSPDFELPNGFRLDDFVASYPWEFAFHAPVEVHLRLVGELAALAHNLFPSSRVEPDSSGAHVRVEATDLDGLMKYVLSLGAACQVLAPDEAKAKHARMAEAVWRAHGGGGAP